MTTNLQSRTVPQTGFGTNDIHAIKPPVEIPDYWIWLWVALGILCLAAALFWYLRSRKKPAESVQSAPVIPPHVRARRRLQAALDLISQPQPFCIEVSDTVRQYLEQRFDFHAPERTTEEFLHELKATNLLLPDQKQSLGDFLNICDMVKFAKYEPGPEELRALHQSAVRLVDETEPQPEPANTPGDTQPA